MRSILLFAAVWLATPSIGVSPVLAGQAAEECVCPCTGAPKPHVQVSDAHPRTLKRVRPAYPESAREQGVHGAVIVEVVIDERGRVEWASVVSGPEDLRPTSLEAACGHVFRPVTLAGKAYRVHGTLTFNFLPSKAKRSRALPN